MSDLPPPLPRSPLFRQEALDAQAPRLHGEIVLMPGAGFRWLAMLSWLLIIGLVLLFATGSYTRRSTVNGQLALSDGLIKVSAPQAGVVVERHATNGQQVTRGQVLFILSGDRAGADSSEYQRGIASQIGGRRRSLEEDRLRVGDLESREADQLRRRLMLLRSETERARRQGELLEERHRQVSEVVRRYRALVSQGYASREEAMAKEIDLNELSARQEGQRREVLSLMRDIATTQRELDTLGARSEQQRAEIERAISVVSQEYAELEARRRIVVSAPIDGTLTLVQPEVGQSVEAGRPLVQVVPSSARLMARLYVPSHAAGFVKPGHRVFLRYEPFPFEKFGQYRGVVKSVAYAAVPASELQGLSVRPELLSEPLFSVDVLLPDAAADPAHAALPLQSGMRVEADLLHESRRLYEWVIEPLVTASARLQDG
jgi:membrane fusion protein